jgi:hypothetical protein
MNSDSGTFQDVLVVAALIHDLKPTRRTMSSTSRELKSIRLCLGVGHEWVEAFTVGDV